MRIQMLGGLLVGALMTTATSHAQTWENPLQFNDSYYTSAMNSCVFPQQMLYMDNGQFPIYAPAVIYHASQFQIGQIGHPIPPLRPWSVTLTPQGTDFSLWVCQQKSGYFVNQCVDLSDNSGDYSPEYVTVPAHRGNYYVIVTGSILQQSPNCGAFTLTAIHS
jgi:hypothetical protein